MVKASLSNYRQSPRKVRIVADIVRGKRVDQALVSLGFVTKRGAEPMRKLIESALANAKEILNAEKQDLYIMKKNFLQDVIPASQKRSIRDIPLPSHRSTQSSRTTHQEPLKSSRPKSEPTPVQRVEEKYVPEQPEEEHSFENKEQVFDPQNLQTSDYSEHPPVEEYKKTAQKPPFKAVLRNEGSWVFKKIFLVAVVAVILFGGFMLSRTQAKVTINPKQDTYEIDVTIPTDISSVAVKTQITKSSSVTLQATSEQQVEKQATGRIKITRV
jgi:large subunit ribosomal protein L22